MRRNEQPEARGSSRAPRISRGFDAFELAKQHGSVRGEVAAADLPRVADCLAPDGGMITYTITGTTDAANRPALQVRLDGVLSLTCQRCLQPMSWTAAQCTTVLLAHDERELVELDENNEHEVVLVEDELLLTLPYAPRHPRPEGAMCAPAAGNQPDEAKPASPFGALAGLKMAREPGKGKRPKR